MWLGLGSCMGFRNVACFDCLSGFGWRAEDKTSFHHAQMLSGSPEHRARPSNAPVRWYNRRGFRGPDTLMRERCSSGFDGPARPLTGGSSSHLSSYSRFVYGPARLVYHIYRCRASLLGSRSRILMFFFPWPLKQGLVRVETLFRTDSEGPLSPSTHALDCFHSPY